MIVLTFAIEGTYIFIIAFQCLPVASLWDPSIKDFTCLNAGVAFAAGAVLNIASDFVLMILPLPALWKLQTSKRKRFGVAFMLAIASLGIVASLVRIKFLIGGSSVFDSSFNNVDIYSWSLIELLCVVACGSIPALRPLLVHTVCAIRSTVSSTFQRSRVSRVSRTGPKSGTASTPRYSVGVQKKAPSDAYSLSEFSTTTKHWKNDLEPPIVVQSRSSALVDLEAANLHGVVTHTAPLSSTDSQDDLIGVIPRKN
ncbi:hypothetical protein BJ166DRAFT_105959 [Pestalotiopsis sp. NC0098]|nr:hypothetical protein BJ166DRAFT_105959 [Pestalotiopsis sp. NC0098]